MIRHLKMCKIHLNSRNGRTHTSKWASQNQWNRLLLRLVVLRLTSASVFLKSIEDSKRFCFYELYRLTFTIVEVKIQKFKTFGYLKITNSLLININNMLWTKPKKFSENSDTALRKSFQCLARKLGELSYLQLTCY